MIKGDNSIHNLTHLIITDIAENHVTYENIFFANQGISYPDNQNFIVIMLDIQKSPLSTFRSKGNSKRININLNIFTKDLILVNKFMDPAVYIDQTKYKDVLCINNGSSIVDRTYLEKGNFLSRYDTGFSIDAYIEQSTSVDNYAKEIGDFKIENQSNSSS